MGVSLYLVFYKKLARPTKKCKLFLLGVAFVAYLFLGAYTFCQINLPIELRERNEIAAFIEDFLLRHPCINREDLNEFISFILNASNSGILMLDKLNNDAIAPNWIFGGETVFFTFTLLSTIGYGHLAPLTQYGRLFCIAYAIIGVPMTCLLLSMFVERLERALVGSANPIVRYRRTYSTMTPSNAASKQGDIYIKTTFVAFFHIIFIYLIPSFLFTNFTELNWTILDSIYYTYISITTIGFGDLVPGEDQIKDFRNVYRLLITIYLFVGIVANMLLLNLVLRLPFFTKTYLLLINLRRHGRSLRHGDELLTNESTQSSRSNSISSRSTSTTPASSSSSRISTPNNNEVTAPCPSSTLHSPPPPIQRVLDYEDERDGDSFTNNYLAKAKVV